jgi:polyhydroxyalkanoate synthesis regulator phasin
MFMKKILRRGFLLGVGIAAYAKDAVEKQVNALAKEGKISAKEGKKVVNEVAKDLNVHRKRLQKELNLEGHRVAGKVGLASQDEIRILKKKIAILEKRAMRTGKRVGKKAAKKAYRVGKRVAKKAAGEVLK